MENTELKQWIIQYLKYRDSMEQRIRQIKDAELGIEVLYDDGQTKFMIVDQLTDECISHMANYQNICTLNSQKNLDFILNKWKELAGNRELTIYFVNLSLGEKWILKPYTHSLIADEQGLAQGLRTMFEAANGKISDDKPKKQKMFEDSEDDEPND